MTNRILVVDDMEFSRDHVRKVLEIDGYEVETAGDGRSALELLRQRPFQLVLTDLRMPDFNGYELLSSLRSEGIPVGVVVLTAYGDTADALRAMKAGADDFLTKPYEPDHLRYLVRRVLERRRLIDELESLRKQLRGDYGDHTILSKSPRMRRVLDLIENVGPTRSTVLIHGETGTGKELVAQALHAADPSRRGPFVALNCAALNDGVLESELFGHERGSFTGADRRKIGRFELAHGGTLLLDEVGDISPALQAKLLRVLQTGTLERVGGTETIRVDVRILAATNRRLEDEVRAGHFRADLYYRLNVVTIELPPLRERKEDIPLLALHFLQKCDRPRSGPTAEFDSEAMQALLAHDWPGNVRELENAVKGAVALAGRGPIRLKHLPEAIAARSPKPVRDAGLIDIDRRLPELTEDLIGRIECEYFTRLLSEYGGNVAMCSRRSGLSRRSVSQKLQKYGIERRDPRKSRRDANHETTTTPPTSSDQSIG
jgi:DNA-binding NtrC family response regulator